MTKTKEYLLWTMSIIITVLYMGFFTYLILDTDKPLYAEDVVKGKQTVIKASIWDLNQNK